MISRTERVANYVILCLFAVIAVFPVLGIISSAITSPGDATGGFSVPHSVHWANFSDAWQQGHLGTYMRNSLVVSAVVVVAGTIFATMAGFAFGTMDFAGGTVLFYLFLLGLMVPEEAYVVPLFFDLRDAGITDSYWALILPQVAQSVSFGVFWMRAYFRSTPRSMIEAARIDGASSWTTLWRILAPMGRPAIVTMMVLIFMWTWNEFLLALVMIPTNESRRTIPLGLAFFQGQHSSDFALLAAGSVIIAAPVVLVYVFLQRHFIAGMLSGSIKE
jgi:raffinose/stachyose/melibiose transport system permease protein